uniref:Uncharacterized protein n=1 Tax=Oryza brachyantha TaxID=4533 RepID=J3MU71_ORYBR
MVASMPWLCRRTEKIAAAAATTRSPERPPGDEEQRSMLRKGRQVAGDGSIGILLLLHVPNELLLVAQSTSVWVREREREWSGVEGGRLLCT